MNYNAIIEKHLRSAVKEILQQVAQDGLHGNQHLFLTFLTQHPGVDIPDYLKQAYPEEMTIVIQYEFEDMHIMHNSFTVKLVFDKAMERIVVPFRSIINVQDPSLDFDLDLEPTSMYEIESLPPSPPKQAEEKSPGQESSEKGQVIDLTDFQN